MTVPVTAKTLAHGLEYMAEGEPAYHLRAKWQRMVEQVEAALIAEGVPATGAADLAAVAARVSNLETRGTVTSSTLSIASGTTPVLCSWTAKTARSSTAVWNAAQPSRLTAPVTGEYDLSLAITWAGNVTGLRGLFYRVSGGAWLAMDLRINAQSTAILNGHTATIRGLELTQAAYVELGLVQNSGSTLAVNPARATLSLAGA